MNSVEACEGQDLFDVWRDALIVLESGFVMLQSQRCESDV